MADETTNGNGGTAMLTHAMGAHDMLRKILAQLRTSTPEVAVGDNSQRELVLEQWPVAGSRRVIAYRTGQGTDGLAIATTVTDVMQGNPARMGGAIVNSGANPIILYLAKPGSVGLGGGGHPSIYLAATGGAWDFRLGNVTWCGHVCAIAQTAASTLTVAEV